MIVACRWPKACDYAGEGFDDVRGQSPRFGISIQGSMMPLLEEYHHQLYSKIIDTVGVLAYDAFFLLVHCNRFNASSVSIW